MGTMPKKEYVSAQRQVAKTNSIIGFREEYQAPDSPPHLVGVEGRDTAHHTGVSRIPDNDQRDRKWQCADPVRATETDGPHALELKSPHGRRLPTPELLPLLLLQAHPESHHR
mmetsp:Transcript_26971/g.50363  ORF Transcript_26971/g.50363 Transcript_26971/m.50363 type:complete len:113 (-) Transcript_26971:406-744(-)